MSEKEKKQPVIEEGGENNGGVPISISDLNERYYGVDINSDEALEALAQEFESLFASDNFSSKAERAESYRKYAFLQYKIVFNLYGGIRRSPEDGTFSSDRIGTFLGIERKRQKDKLIKARDMLSDVMNDFGHDSEHQATQNLADLNDTIRMFESFDRNVEIVNERLKENALLFCRLTFGDNEAGVRLEEDKATGRVIMFVNGISSTHEPYSSTFQVTCTNRGELAYINWPGMPDVYFDNFPEGMRWNDVLLQVLQGRRVNGYGVELEEYKAGMTEADYVGAESLLSGGSETKISEEARQFLRKENVTFQSHKIREGEGKYVEFFCRMDEDGKVKTLYGDIYQGSVAEIDVMGGELVFSIKRGDKKILVSGGSFGEVMDRYMWEEREINIAYYKAAVSDFRKNDLKTMFRYIHRRFPEFGVAQYFKEKTGEDLNR